MTLSESIHRNRRTFGARHTEEEAYKLLNEVGRLFNGTPYGSAFFVAQKMGKWVAFLCSYP